MLKDIKHIHIVVIGDVGHSPRMINHCEAAVENGFQVSLVGCLESEVPNLVSAKKISFFELRSGNYFSQTLPRLLKMLLKGFLLFFQLFYYACFRINRNDKIVIQNPPALPAIAAFLLVKWIKPFKIFVDWHNFGYTLLQPSSISRALYYCVEHAFAIRHCDGNFSVSFAMKNALVREFGMDYDKIIVCKDKPKKEFAKTTESQAVQLMEFLCQSCPEVRRCDFFENPKSSTWKGSDERPYVLVCATSWTIDERMDILFDAIEHYEKSNTSREIYLFITGKGPMRLETMKRAQKKPLCKVKISSLWLSSEHYRQLVGFADFGLSFHASSSGYDLPMKVVDYLAGGIPCFCLRYKCLQEELIQEGENGFLFDDALELSYLLLKHLNVPRSKNVLLSKMKDSIGNMYPEKWNSYWKLQVFQTLSK
jgi:beta-1,4-mannosyltransferase